MILYSVITFNDETLFPGLSAVIPCLGTAMAIFAGKPKLLGGLLASKSILYRSSRLSLTVIYAMTRFLQSVIELHFGIPPEYAARTEAR